jgi:hypothetical protein
VGYRARYIRDHENRLDTDDASHDKSIRTVARLRPCISVRRRSLMVWRREPDGRWRIAREMLTEDA